jgi:hypothetical protein
MADAAISSAIEHVMSRHPGADTLGKLRRHVEEHLGLAPGSLGRTKVAKSVFSGLVKQSLSRAAASESSASVPAKRKREAAPAGESAGFSSSVSQSSGSESDAAAPPPAKRKRAPEKRKRAPEKRKRAPAKSKLSRREVQLRKMAKAVATGPRVFNGLAALSGSEREDALASRLRDASSRFAEWKGRTPTNAEIAAAKARRDMQLELEDMDTANILSPGAGRGGRRRRGSAPPPLAAAPAAPVAPPPRKILRRNGASGDSSSEEEYAFS